MAKKGRPALSEGPKTTKIQLLMIATSLIGKRGVINTSLRAIADEAKVSLSAVQYHFPTKKSLLLAIIDDLVIPFEQSRSSVGKTLQDYYSSVILGRLNRDIETPGLTGKIISGNEGEEEILLDYLAAQIEDIIKGDRTRIIKGKKDGELRNIYPEALMALIGIALPILSSSSKAVKKFLKLELESKNDRVRLAKGIAEIILYGILPRKDEEKT